MEKFILWMRAAWPVLFSPQFWGIVATATFTLAKAKHWVDQDYGLWLQTIFGFTTAVGVGFKAIKKSVPIVE